MNERIQQYLAGVEQGAPAATPATGLGRLQNAANRLVACDVCGSTWLFEISLQQYRPGYSAGAGGDLQPVSEAPQVVRMCPCGNVIPPTIGGVKGGRTPNSILDSLIAALRNAKAKSAEVQQQIADLATAAAEKSVVDELMARVEGLEKTIKEMIARPAEAEPEEATDQAKPKKGGKKPEAKE